MPQHDTALEIDTTRQTVPGTKTSQNHNAVQQTPGKTRATVKDTHSTLLKSSNWPMTVKRRRQGQQLYAYHDQPRRPPAWQPLPLAVASEDTQPNPEALSLEAWSCECNTGEKSAERTGVWWQNSGGGGEEQFQISWQQQGGGPRDQKRECTHGLSACTKINTGCGSQPERGG